MMQESVPSREKCNTGSLRRLEEDATIRNGAQVHIRPMRPEDEEKLLAFFRALSSESRWRRFFAPVKDFTLVNEAHKESEIDCDKRFGLLATITEGDRERVVGQAIYFRLSDTHADAAFTIADDYQGCGLGTLLLLRLAEFAVTRGIRVFEADVMADNQVMIDVFRNAGFNVTTKMETGVIHLEFPIDEPETYRRQRAS